MKALGVLYHATTDKLQFFAFKTPAVWTMRTLASYVMQLFDPLELLSLVVQKGRRLTQLLWWLKCKWDEPLDESLARAADAYARMLAGVHALHIRRCIRSPLDVVGWEIACFVDASSHTMAACLYQRTIYLGGSITSHLICSKMKLVPVKKPESIPRAETQAGVIGVKLAFDLATAYQFDMRKVIFFSDLTTLLWWLRTTNPMSIFVANRVCQILDRTQLKQWHHVSTNENPADLPTRGATPVMLGKSALWWNGPKFLSELRSRWPKQPDIFPTLEAEQEEASLREIVASLSFIAVEEPGAKFQLGGEKLAALMGHYGSLRKGLRIAALVWVFTSRMLDRSSSLQLAERETGLEMKLICYDQEKTFVGLKQALLSTGRVPHPLVPLCPFLGPYGELRSDSRLQKLSQLNPEAWKPIILGRTSKLSVEILRDIHTRDLRHCGGVNTLLAEAGQRFLLIGGRQQARVLCRECPRYQRRNSPRPLEVISPPLHPNRGGLRMRPFAETGVDMAGPFSVKHGKTRAQVKIYAILFVCCATRAVNIEAVESASADSLRMAFEQHCARYGCPENVYSDNGSNFVGLNNELKEQYLLWNKSAK